MAKTTVQELFDSYIDDRSTVFVFPSAVPAQAWARRLCETKGKPLALERFIAWDQFKEQCLSVHRPDQKPANSLSRILFASFILEKNAREAAAGAPLFTEFLPPSHAGEYTPFINHTATLLPSLKTVIEQSGRLPATGSPGTPTDPYLLDLTVLYHSYADFLASHSLYEPDWIRSPFQARDRHWVLLFPDLADDWESYKQELSQQNTVSLYTIQDIHIDEPAGALQPPSAQDALPEALNRGLLKFPSAREEIRYVAKLLSYLLHNRILEPENIALSIAGLENYTEELSLECRLREIPLSIRLGKKITDQSGGRLFSHLEACYRSHWSYRALKQLLTDRSLPWKEPDLVRQFLDFGLQFRCLTGYNESDEERDVWDDTFRHLLDEKIEAGFSVTKLKRFYRQLKRDILDIVTAETFEELRSKLLLFTGNHLNRETMNAEADRVYARAMEELGSLIETEQSLADCSTGKAFPIFLAHLKNTTYVHQSETRGIPVYPYRVAAGTAVKLHIVMNATQDALSVSVDPAPFLREDRKRALTLSSIDRSDAFISAYCLTPVTIFTAPERGFTGHTIPHQALTSRREIRIFRDRDIPSLEDVYYMEETGNDIEGARPFPIQKAAWENSILSRRPYTPSRDIRKAAIDMDALRLALYTSLTTKNEAHHISPTDINSFLTCPFQWLLTRGLAIVEPQREIETIGQKDIGILYHAILEAFFELLKEAPGKGVFKDEIPQYKNLMQTIIGEKLEAQRHQEGAFQESVYSMLAPRIREHLFAFLDNEIPSLDGCFVLGAEYPLKRAYPRLGIYLAGKADILLLDNEGQLVIIDYKTSNQPKNRELWFNEDHRVENLQMAAYIRMAEEQCNARVSRATFYSIEKREHTMVIHPDGPKRKNSVLPVKREDYLPVLQTMDATLKTMVTYLKEGRYPVVEATRRRICATCTVAPVCRITFSGGDRS